MGSSHFTIIVSTIYTNCPAKAEVPRIMRLLWLNFVMICFLCILIASTSAGKGDKDKGEDKDKDKGKGKGKCPAVPKDNKCKLTDFELKCCSTKDCGKGKICCQKGCKLTCMKEKDPEGKGSAPEINISNVVCKALNKTIDKEDE
ncbi:hypothetical protein TNCT_59331 [Trichonephila clavata]|uniref:WAP domain-containing protein n=1 Tax=Trichonephila clavata TaxID=2740835 RepID=A0A8X6GDQ4_TRICU|nr:hypothetical protein TNCT_59331 [Trichonephila clavata]